MSCKKKINFKIFMMESEYFIRENKWRVVSFDADNDDG
jgi:hypothetical protein